MAQVETSNTPEDQVNNNIRFVDDDDEKDEQQQQQTNQKPIRNEPSSGSNDFDTDAIKNQQSYDSNNDNDTSINDTDDSTKTNLIVNYLPQQMTDEEFEDLFKEFGPMKSCKIVRNKVSGYSYGFGFVDFETHEQALKAIDELNGHELETKKIKVAFARPAGQDIKQANLYIKNVPNDWSQDDVRKAFEPYGNIIQVRVLGNNRGVAFVLYDLRKQAEDALDALNGKTLAGCETPLEIKFAADKKVEKGPNTRNNANTNNNNSGNNGNNDNNNNNNNNNTSNGQGSGRRERGRRGGRNRDRNRQQNQGPSFFDRQNNGNNNNYNDRQATRRSNQYNAVPYGGGAQYQDNFNNGPNGAGPVRHAPNRANRYAPFVPVQQPSMAPIPPTQPIMPQIGPTPTYGFPTQQQMIPFTMLPAQQMASMQPLNHLGQMAQNQLAAMYGTVQMPMGYAPVSQSTMDSIYSVASNNMNNAANMQPQIGQPMMMRNNTNNNSASSSNFDEGVTLFVYNIGPDTDEDEMRTMFSPYGQVVKCNVVRKTPGGETKGFGFVTLKDRNQANAAIAGMNGSMRNGRALQVSLKK